MPSTTWPGILRRQSIAIGLLVVILARVVPPAIFGQNKKAARRLGWELVGIRDGFEGLLNRDRYPDGGLVPLGPALFDNLDPSGSGLLGLSLRVDPFQVRKEDGYGMLEERDMSEPLLATLRTEGLDGMISVVGMQGLSILYKLN